MLRTLDPERDQLIEQAMAEAGDAGPVRHLMAHYLQHVPGEDLRERSPEDLAALLRAHGELARVRPPGVTRARVIPPGTGDWTAGHEVVQIVTDDMPFLVDSVTAELVRHRRDIHLLIHPQVVVRRDEAGTLLEVLSTESPIRKGETPPAGAVVESWIHVDIDPEPAIDPRPYPDPDPDPGLGGSEGLLAGLTRVLDDVRAAVTDWPRMRGTAMALAAELAAPERPPAGPVPTDRAIELLRWLADDHFTFLSYAEYRLRPEDDVLVAVEQSRLGVAHIAEDRVVIRGARQEGGPGLLRLSKADARSTVHRRAYLDQIGLAVLGPDGELLGERRFLGLFAAAAYTDSVRHIPVISDKVEEVLERAGFDAESHSGKDLLEILETYPRDELFEIGVADLTETAVAVMHLQERRRTRLFVRPDVYGRYVSCLVYLPRDRYTTEVRQRITDVLDHAFGGSATEFSARVGESVLARLYMVVRLPQGQEPPEVDLAAVEDALVEVTRTWEEELEDELRAVFGDQRGAEMLRRWGGSFPEAYKEDVEPARAVDDLVRLEKLDAADPAATGLRLVLTDGPTHRFTLYRQETVTLSAVLPFLADLGADVVDERPYRLQTRSGRTAYVFDFGLRSGGPVPVTAGAEAERASEKFCDAFAAAWNGAAESDGFARLVLLAGLDWRQVSLLRAYAKYLRLTGTTFSQVYLEECLCTHAPISRRLVRLFEARFAPDKFRDGRLEVAEALEEEIRTALDDVVSLDHDRILRSYLTLVQATLRTNYFAEPRFDDVLPALALKLDARSLAELPGMPQPLPTAEVFVYSPRVEGVHLRFGAVARGGLRWSDRREDFRTEVLGLVKAQTVKNAVIVPTGAKGGFVPKRLPDPAVDRDAWLAEGIACYRSFVGSLLDVTDNLKSAVGGHGTVVVPPERVVRHDGDDPYLVVAADKGTAAFSDIANALAARYGFWLGDAFASGGSVGYDHKAMGITARGAWESVKWHFRELGVDVQTQEITAVGVGDMSGDVFGNGMLLSEQLRVVAAFDHRHVFLDPDPDAAASFAERQRLFALPRSSWEDYDPSLISPGGGVHPRSAKSVPITPQVAERLGLARRGSPAPTSLTPAELIKGILRAPVDLLWNGGIGTYVKASDESHLDAGDKTNDALRVDGHQLRVKVVGEGGNLGLTQKGRIEAALAGVRLNTDAIDNSAGVDCSDHEVNIKILLDQVVASGDLTAEGRGALLRDMTDEVGALVLRDNYEQNQLLASSRAGARGMVPVHQRFMRHLEGMGALNRGLEFLPSDAALSARAEDGRGLTSPELSVLAAYGKLVADHELLGTDLPDDAWLERVMRSYFPTPIVLRYSDRLPAHPLRREIVTNVLVNDMINLGGPTFVFRAQEETGAEAEQVARAFVVVREIFGLRELVTQIEQLDGRLPAGEQAAMMLMVQRLLDRGVRWFLRHRPGGIGLAAEIERFAGTLDRLVPQLPSLVVGAERSRIKDDLHALTERGLPDALARRMSSLLLGYVLLDVTEVAARVGGMADDVARVYLRLSERYGVEEMLTRVARLPRRDRWQALARAALRDESYAALEAITLAVLRSTVPTASPVERIELWEEGRRAAVDRATRILADIGRLDAAELAPLSVAAATLRSIAAAGD